MTAAPLFLYCQHADPPAGLELSAPPGCDLARSTSLAESLACLRARRPAGIVLLPLAPGSAAEALALARALAGGEPVPLLVLVPAEALARQATALRQSGYPVWDVASVDAPASELAVRLELLAGATAMRAELSALRHRVQHDDRTDLLRPVAFEERLREHFSAAQRHGFDLTLVLLDLDGFGKINKQFDHTVGDRLIAAAAAALRSGLRAEDVAGRLGGDEFGLILPYTGRASARAVAERCRNAIGEVDVPVAAGDRTARLGASAGFQTYDGKSAATAAELRAAAERALRSAKQHGGGCTVDAATLAPAATAGLGELED